jgi:hypothetical protein
MDRCACGNEAAGKAVSMKTEAPICSECIAKSLTGDAYLHAHDIPESQVKLKRVLARLIQLQAITTAAIKEVQSETEGS